MSLILRTSFDNSEKFENELDRVWHSWLAPFRTTGAGGVAQPSLDVAETESEVQVTAELPGLSEKDIDVTLVDDTLTIKGEKKEEEKEEGKHFHRVERRYGSFERCLRLPSPVDTKAVSAKFENGVLTITLPKAEEAKPKKIEIN
jgi:HSP20 family protein